MRFLELYDAARTSRFHTTVDYTNSPKQNLAEHSWGVAMIVLELHRRMYISPSVSVIQAALEHDLAEAWTGDMAANAKWRYPKLARMLREAEVAVNNEIGITQTGLTEIEELILEWADKMELFIYAWKRHQAGMWGAQSVLSNIRRKLMDMDDLPEGVGRAFLVEVERNIDRVPSFMV